MLVLLFQGSRVPRFHKSDLKTLELWNFGTLELWNFGTLELTRNGNL
jgi:hypothetical protein